MNEVNAKKLEVMSSNGMAMLLAIEQYNIGNISIDQLDLVLSPLLVYH